MSGGGIVLAYHRVTTLATDPQLLAVTPEHFAEHLKIIGRLGNPIPLTELAAAGKQHRLPRRSIAITFDDGYADNLHQAAPLLQTAAMPATVFCTTGRLGGDAEFFWDELDRLLLQPGELPTELTLTIGGAERRFDLSRCSRYTQVQWETDRHWDVTQPPRPASRQQLYLQLCQAIHPMPSDARAATLDLLRRWAGASSAGRATHRMMSAGELRQLAADGVMEVGAHTVEHSLLSAESVKRQRSEIESCRATLTDIVGKSITSLSYPFGTRRDYTAGTIAAVRRAGFEIACSNFQGIVNSDTDPLQLPRFLVRDWDPARFTAELSAWLALA
jgi:peptidoglycan/xylan/chitin deacetylase (PgdA/CDA1 family)